MLPPLAELDVEPRWHDVIDPNAWQTLDRRDVPTYEEAVRAQLELEKAKAAAEQRRPSFEFAVSRAVEDVHTAEQQTVAVIARQTPRRRTNPCAGRPGTRRVRRTTSSNSRGDPDLAEPPGGTRAVHAKGGGS